ncbi:hypothetical protein J4437_05745 [Candidatus Woesearchaeota archaeon]|nr:hypothetical protein [Candidatus Woesearchaeota archaeon]
MNIHDINLEKLNGPLKTTLSYYESFYPGLKFSNFSNFVITPEKSYSARTDIPVTYKNINLGNLCAIIFAKGDGTGNSNDYNLSQFISNLFLIYSANPDSVIPRKKEGITYEGCFPLFSVSPIGFKSMFALSLEILGVDKGETKIVSLGKIGQDAETYAKALEDQIDVNLGIYVTTGNTKQGKRFGDPHSIYYNPNTPDALQVAGFLAIKEDYFLANDLSLIRELIND